jgi:hypothetical protein
LNSDKFSAQRPPSGGFSLVLGDRFDVSLDEIAEYLS